MLRSVFNIGRSNIRFINIITLFFFIFCSGCSLKRNSITNNHNFQHAFAYKTISVVAPGSGTSAKNIQELEDLACFHLSIPKNLITQSCPIHANLDDQRYLYLSNALSDTSKNSIVWTVRGGYGAARLINHLEKLKKPKVEKIYIGYSDNTALHLFLSQKWNWKTIHGAGLIEILNPEKDPKNFEKIAEIIAGKTASLLALDNLTPLNDAAKKATKVRGRLTGGNLSVVQSSIGTSWQINAAGKILFLEDINEPGYRVDKMLTHLKQAGIFKKVKGIIFGDFTDPEDKFVNFVLERFAGESGIPIFKTDQFGHGRTNYPLIYNSMSEVVCSHESNKNLLIMNR